MNIVGIIAEYNPFHNGHQYQLRKSKALTNADGVICVMSGNFLQRGEPALLDKWERTRMAIVGGADLVIELPVLYALRSAEFFAFGGVSLLDATGMVTHLSFGSEAGNLEKLSIIAQLLAQEPEELDELIGHFVERGLSYPAARTQALSDFARKNALDLPLSVEEVEYLTSNPNNILGLEYLKALTRLQSKIQPVTVPRITAGYHEREIKAEIASATAIRENLRHKWASQENLFDEQVLSTMPEASRTVLQEAFANGKGPIFTEDFAAPILTLIRRSKPAEIARLFDVQGGLENRIKEAAETGTSLQELIERVKMRRYTWTRLQRSVFHLLLNLTAMDCEYFDQMGGPQYIRILGFNARGRKILAHLKGAARLPVITRVAKFMKNSDTPEPVKRMLEKEILATNLYSLATPNPDFRRGNRDLLEQPVILPHY